MPESTTTRSRRAVLAGAAAGVATAALGSLAKPGLAIAAGSDGQTVVIGTTYADVQSTTTLTNVANNNAVLAAFSDPASGHGGGTGLHAVSDSGVGVIGVSNSSWGVYALSQSNAALRAYSQSSFGADITSDASDGIRSVTNGAAGTAAVRADGGTSGTGVIATATAAAGVSGSSPVIGVIGISTTGTGVIGTTTTGVGVHAGTTTPTALALDVAGRARFTQVSGVAPIAIGKTSVTITPGVDVTSKSFVLLTPNTSLSGRSLWYTTSATANTITIRISSARTSATKIAWLLLG